MEFNKCQRNDRGSHGYGAKEGNIMGCGMKDGCIVDTALDRLMAVCVVDRAVEWFVPVGTHPSLGVESRVALGAVQFFLSSYAVPTNPKLP